MPSEETHLPAWMDAWTHVRDLAQARGMYFGAGASASQLQQDPNLRLTLAREYNPAITTWGIADCRSWLGAFDGPDDVGPLPWDRSYRPKPAPLAMKQALAKKEMIE